MKYLIASLLLLSACDDYPTHSSLDKAVVFCSTRGGLKSAVGFIIQCKDGTEIGFSYL